MKKVDFDKMAGHYDPGREMREENTKLWMEKISEILKTDKKRDKDIFFLDLACGTGRLAISISEMLKYSVIGADKSEKMLEQAMKKAGAEFVYWDKQDAYDTNYPEDTFDAVLVSHLLHNTDNPLKIIKECYRIVKPNQPFMCRHSAIEDTIDDADHIFFPETIAVDRARTPSKTKMQEWYKEAGFKNIKTDVIVQRTFEDSKDRLEKTKRKCTTSLLLIDEKAFNKGYELLKAYIKKNPKDRWVLENKVSITYGVK